jgi:CHASE2 domain-containing sensor protein
MLAMRYLSDRQIPIQFSPQGLQIGKYQIAALQENAGGYFAQDAQGLQILLNYRRTAQGIAQTVTLQQALSGELPAAAIKDRIILIGSVNPSSNDFWATPFGSGFSQQQPGVFIHAQMVSQILSAVGENRPLLNPLKLPQLIILSLGCGLIGGSIALIQIGYYRWLLLGCTVVIIYSGTWLGLTQGLWIPIAMPALSLIGSSLLVSVSRQVSAQKQQKD